VYSLPLKASSSGVSANSKVFNHFIGMGFSGEMVSKVIQEYGKNIASLY